MNKSRPCCLGTVASLVLMLAIFSTGCVNKTESKLTPAQIDLAKTVAVNGIYTKADFERLETIESSIKMTKSINDNDFDFMIALVDKPSKSHTIVIGEVYAYIEMVSQLSAGQKKKLYDSVIRSLHNLKNDNYDLALCSVLNTLGRLGQTDSVAIITPYKSSNNEQVRFCANRAIYRITSRSEIWK